MPPDQTFHGPFIVRVVEKNAPVPQRLVVSGSDSSDGPHRGELGDTVEVTGAMWTLDLQFFAPEPADPAGWVFSLVQQSVAFTVEDGLVFTLRASNASGFIGRIPEFGDIVVTVTSTNPDLNPMHPPAPAPDFSLPKGAGDEPPPDY
jgi:hypothetical protein